MPKSKERLGIKGLPPLAVNEINLLGSRIKKARVRRRLRQQDLADRMSVSIKSYRKIESGDPTVSLGLMVSALSMLGLLSDLNLVAQPENDTVGKLLEHNRAPERVRAKENKELNF